MEIRKPNVILANTGAVAFQEESSEEHAFIQKLDTTWLPFAAKMYQISPNLDDYIFVTTPICPSDIPNRNGVGFPLAELTRFMEPPINRMAYKGWIACPVHYEHKNEIHRDAYGVVFDVYLSPVVGYGRGKLWKVMAVIGIDKTKNPTMAERIRKNEVNTYSMGALVDSFTCSYCKTPASYKSHCHHIQMKKDDFVVNWRGIPDISGKRHIAFLNAHYISPIELSIVESPAWTTALSDTILTNSG